MGCPSQAKRKQGGMVIAVDEGKPEQTGAITRDAFMLDARGEEAKSVADRKARKSSRRFA
jgi:hypothetical protein